MIFAAYSSTLTKVNKVGKKKLKEMMNDNMQMSDFWIVTNQDGLSRHLVQVSLAQIKLKQLKEMVKIQSTVHPLE